MQKRNLVFISSLAAIFLLILGACSFPSTASIEGSDTVSPAVGTSEPVQPPTETDVPASPLVPANSDGAETILIPGVTFWMGSDEDDPLADEDEMPRHEVTQASFYIYTHEVTNTMYAQCVVAGACSPVSVLETGPTSHFDDPAYAEFPVVGVNFVDAKNYCGWAGGRLPTETEWELAARGSESLIYPWGEEQPDCTRVNMLGCLVPPDTTVVGSYARGNSPYDLWDMSGNVWEWVNDWYAEEYYALSPKSNPVGPYSYQDPEHPLKVVRGGGLYSEPASMRTTARVGANPYRAFDDVGFRCVVGDLVLPRTYVPVDDRHEMAPPDPLAPGGEHVEDPENPWERRWGEPAYSCPTPAGTMFLFIPFDTSEPTGYRVTVNDDPIDCFYDEFLRGLQCEAPLPDDFAVVGFFEIVVETDFGDPITFRIDFPDECPAGAAAPASFTSSITCPDDEGLFIVTFDYEPAINWMSFQQFVAGGFVDGPCWQVSDHQALCVVPVDPTAMAYTFLLLGTSETGEDVNRLETVVLPEGCPLIQRHLSVEPFCFEERPTVQFDIGLDEIFESASIGGEPLSCFAMADGVWICGDLPGDPGSDVTVSICLEGQPCTEVTLPVPDCSGSQQAHWIRLTPGCYEGIGSVVMIEYPLEMPALTSASADGTALTCIDSPTGAYLCYPLAGEAGDIVNVEFCLDDGTCLNEDVIVQDCSGPVGWDEPTVEEWEMGAAGCHSETQIFFMFDSQLDWLVPGAGFTYSASDGTVDFVCSLIEAVPGRIYCTGDRPESPGTLTFCVEGAGTFGIPTCGYFSDFPAWVAMIPSCEPAAPILTCSDYTDSGTCSNHGCTWTNGVCH